MLCIAFVLLVFMLSISIPFNFLPRDLYYRDWNSNSVFRNIIVIIITMVTSKVNKSNRSDNLYLLRVPCNNLQSKILSC